MKKDKLVLLVVKPKEDLIRLSRNQLYQESSFMTHIENADNPRLHMFVASNSWEELIIQMKDTEAINSIKYMLPKFKKVTVFIFGDVTLHMVQVLGEIYPEKASLIRRTYMSGGDVKFLLEKGEWKP